MGNPLHSTYPRVRRTNQKCRTIDRLSFRSDQSSLIQTIAEDLAITVNYDPDLQISSIAHTLPQPFAESYSYDDNGNRLTSLSNSFIYDDLNRLNESTTHEYTYDADGNMTSERNKLTGETKTYYWDSENRLIGFEHRASDIAPIDIAAAYKYDIFGRRLQKNVNNAITNFFWEGDTLAYELNEQYQPIRKYLTTGLGEDDYEGHLEYSETTDWSRIFDYQYYQGWYSYMSDQVGTVYKVYDHRNRRIADDRTYDSFGNLVSQTGTTKTPLGFQGKYYDSESGLNYFYHRYYNPVLGRFISEGPVGFLGGLNLHSFVNNNPISSIDPTGTKTDVNSFPIYIPFQDIKISGSAFSWQSFKEMICGDVKLCKKDSFWDNVWENFRQTNEAIPGILAPGIGPIGLGYLTSSELVEITNRITLMQWAMRGFSGMTLGGASFNAIETGIIAGTTSFANFLFVGAAWESGVFIGSLIRAALCD